MMIEGVIALWEISMTAFVQITSSSFYCHEICQFVENELNLREMIWMNCVGKQKRMKCAEKRRVFPQVTFTRLQKLLVLLLLSGSTSKKLAHSINSTLDENNYQKSAIPIGAKVQSMENIYFQPFELFITPNIMNRIVKETNRKISSVLTKLPRNVQESDFRNPCFSTTNEMKMYCLVLSTSVVDWGYLIIGTIFYFTKKQGFAFRRIMSFVLVAHISFDDGITRTQRWKEDRFAAIRHSCEDFNGNSKYVKQVSTCPLMRLCTI